MSMLYLRLKETVPRFSIREGSRSRESVLLLLRTVVISKELWEPRKKHGKSSNFRAEVSSSQENSDVETLVTVSLSG
jgi:hypothetical protein